MAVLPGDRARDGPGLLLSRGNVLSGNPLDKHILGKTGDAVVGPGGLPFARVRSPVPVARRLRMGVGLAENPRVGRDGSDGFRREGIRERHVLPGEVGNGMLASLDARPAETESRVAAF